VTERTTIGLKVGVRDRLDEFRKGHGIGKVTFEDAIKALLDFWDQKHK